jgi:hypothetical protein
MCENLFLLCVKGGVKFCDDNMGMFEYMKPHLPKQGESGSEKSKEINGSGIVSTWLGEKELVNDCGVFRSAYGNSDGVESIPFSNVTRDFKGGEWMRIMRFGASIQPPLPAF